eukprot:comp22070_c0_seq1/m.51092 comp22070_c0_seq1/g.51092  ORF comp22070_c0_seq1/g.51092 comp22070_c0_seq1/m.51092 type:complete len:415 (-) comp22070_c0_seq1:343-1587(-)
MQTSKRMRRRRLCRCIRIHKPPLLCVRKRQLQAVRQRQLLRVPIRRLGLGPHRPHARRLLHPLLPHPHPRPLKARWRNIHHSHILPGHRPLLRDPHRLATRNALALHNHQRFQPQPGPLWPRVLRLLCHPLRSHIGTPDLLCRCFRHHLLYHKTELFIVPSLILRAKRPAHKPRPALCLLLLHRHRLLHALSVPRFHRHSRLHPRRKQQPLHGRIPGHQVRINTVGRYLHPRLRSLAPLRRHPNNRNRNIRHPRPPRLHKARVLAIRIPRPALPLALLLLGALHHRLQAHHGPHRQILLPGPARRNHPHLRRRRHHARHPDRSPPLPVQARQQSRRIRLWLPVHHLHHHVCLPLQQLLQKRRRHRRRSRNHHHNRDSNHRTRNRRLPGPAAPRRTTQGPPEHHPQGSQAKGPDE